MSYLSRNRNLAALGLGKKSMMEVKIDYQVVKNRYMRVKILLRMICLYQKESNI